MGIKLAPLATPPLKVVISLASSLLRDIHLDAKQSEENRWNIVLIQTSPVTQQFGISMLLELQGIEDVSMQSSNMYQKYRSTTARAHHLLFKQEYSDKIIKEADEMEMNPFTLIHDKTHGQSIADLVKAGHLEFDMGLLAECETIEDLFQDSGKENISSVFFRDGVNTNGLGSHKISCIVGMKISLAKPTQFTRGEWTLAIRPSSANRNLVMKVDLEGKLQTDSSALGNLESLIKTTIKSGGDDPMMRRLMTIYDPNDATNDGFLSKDSEPKTSVVGSLSLNRSGNATINTGTEHDEEDETENLVLNGSN